MRSSAMCKLFSLVGACLMAWTVPVCALAATAKSSGAVQKNIKAVKIIHDCSVCPRMVIIPGGNFLMGSAVAEKGHRKDEIPVHRVSIAAFALGKTEITRGQFAEFVKESGYKAGDKCWTIEAGKYEERSASWQKVGYAQNNNHPVVCVNWNDANAYTQWISRKTGKKYRLPTEAEWEYAARGKILTSRYWGRKPDDACLYANIADKTAQKIIKLAASWEIHNCTDGYAYTAPVASFKANAYGLYDLLGNVWEWVADDYHKNYLGAPVGGSAWAGDDNKHVLRGGSWYDAPNHVRAAGRDKSKPVSRYDNIGFRIAREIP